MSARRHATRVQPRRHEPSSEPGLFGRVCRLLARVLAVVVIGVSVFVLFWSLEKLVDYVNAQRVEMVRIEGELKQTPKEFIQQVVAPYAGLSFLRIDLDRLKSDMEAAPWVRAVSIQREWPDTLIVHMYEQQAIARWNRTALLNQFGEVFKPEDVASLPALALLEGPEGRELEVMQQYQKFSQVLLPLGLRLRALTLSSRGAWMMEMDNGVQVNVGKIEVVDRLQRFTRVLEGKLFGDFHDIKYIDLRYRNGIAVQRRNDETMISAR